MFICLNLLQFLISFNFFENSLLMFMFMERVSCLCPLMMEQHKEQIEIVICMRNYQYNKYPSRIQYIQTISSQTILQFKLIQNIIINPIFNYSSKDTNMVKNLPKKSRTAPHSFKIIGGPHKYIKDEVEVSFKPLPKSKSMFSRRILPTFNVDRKYYTSTFTIPSATPQKDQQTKREHDRRSLQSLIEIQQILYPKPRSKHKYCGVCKDSYEDYKQHVQQNPHLQNLRRSPFQKLIIEQADKIASLISEKKQQYDKILQSSTEDQLFKCLSFQTIPDKKLQGYVQ